MYDFGIEYWLLLIDVNYCFINLKLGVYSILDILTIPVCPKWDWAIKN